MAADALAAKLHYGSSSSSAGLLEMRLRSVARAWICVRTGRKYMSDHRPSEKMVRLRKFFVDLSWLWLPEHLRKK